jgi:RND family efflux transporter MFP subunit
VKYGKCLLVFVLFVFACDGQDDNYESQISVPVSVEEMQYRSIEQYFSTTGTLNAIQNTELKAETGGYYRLVRDPRTGLTFGLGSRVKKDEVIIILDNPEQENSIAFESKKLNLDISKREYEKQNSLYEKGGVTLLEFKNSERAYIDAKYSYENAIIQLAKMNISAPFDGVIVDLPYYTPNTKVDAGADMLQVMNYSRLYMDVNLPGKEIARIRRGQSVRVMNYTTPDDTLWGKITQVSPALDEETRSFKATVEIENPEWLLRPGMFAKADIVVARKDSALVIPKDIVLTQRDDKVIYVVERGAARRREITTGLENPGEIEVTEGLNVDERLVIKGFETLRHNSKVRIIG